MDIDWQFAILVLLGLWILNEAHLHLVRRDVTDDLPKLPPNSYAFDDFRRGIPYRRRWDDRDQTILIQILPTANPMGGKTPTYAIIVELELSGSTPPDCLFFWLDFVEWPLSKDDKVIQLPGNRTAVEYYGIVEESLDKDRQHPPTLRRIPLEGEQP